MAPVGRGGGFWGGVGKMTPELRGGRERLVMELARRDLFSGN